MSKVLVLKQPKGLQFDGVSEYITIPTTPTTILTSMLGGQNLSISFVANINSFGGAERELFQSSNGAIAQRNFDITIYNNSEIRIGFINNQGGLGQVLQLHEICCVLKFIKRLKKENRNLNSLYHY